MTPEQAIQTGDSPMFDEDEVETILSRLDDAGFVIVPKELTPAIACALEMCAPPEAQTPGAVAKLVEDYRDTWGHVIAASQQS